jgi:hypothetical protein
MELGEVKIEGQLKAATDGGMNIDNMDIGADDEGIGFKHVGDYTARDRGDKHRRQLCGDPCGGGSSTPMRVADPAGL